VVNNAGITRDATMRKMTEDQFDAVIVVHLRGCWKQRPTAAAIMLEAGHGSIINVSSISGKVGFVGQTNDSAAKEVAHTVTHQHHSAWTHPHRDDRDHAPENLGPEDERDPDERSRGAERNRLPGDSHLPCLRT
jgi:hypothetical protein